MVRTVPSNPRPLISAFSSISSLAAISFAAQNIDVLQENISTFEQNNRVPSLRGLVHEYQILVAIAV